MQVNKRAITVIIILVIASTKAVAQSPVSLSYFNRQCEILLKYGGKWKTRNAEYKPSDSLSASYYGCEFSKGINNNTISFKTTHYLPATSEWKIFSEGYFTWDAKKQKLICITIYADGETVNMESVSIKDDELTFESSPGELKKDMSRQKVQIKIKTDDLGLIEFDNEWKPMPVISFSRLEQPMGSLIFMSTRDGNFEIYSMDTKGENLKNLSCNKAVDYAFSSFNNRLLFYSNRDGNNEIYIQEADGRKVTNLTNHPSSDRIAGFSPDGGKIVFVSNRDQKSVEIYVMDTTGKNLLRLTDNEYFEDAGGFSPDGKKIIFSRELRDLKDTSRNAVTNGEIFIMDADGKNEMQLTSKPGFDGGPQISPDGKRIAFYGKSEKGKYDIFLMDIDGRNMINLTDDAVEDYSPSWSPDGKWIAFTRGDSKNYDVWLIHLETKIKTRLTTQPRRDESPYWIPAK